MRFQGKHPPQTAAQRQAKCRAIKRGTYQYCEQVPQPPLPPGMPIPRNPICYRTSWPSSSGSRDRHRNFPPRSLRPVAQQALPPAAAPVVPPATAIQKSLSSDSRSLAPLGGEESGDGPRLCLPAGGCGSAAIVAR